MIYHAGGYFDPADLVVRCPGCGWRGKGSEARCPPDDLVTCKSCGTPVEVERTNGKVQAVSNIRQPAGMSREFWPMRFSLDCIDACSPVPSPGTCYINSPLSAELWGRVKKLTASHVVKDGRPQWEVTVEYE